MPGIFRFPPQLQQARRTLIQSGVVAITGAGDVSIGPPVLAAAGSFATTGSGAVSIAGPVLAGTGTFATTGSGAVTVGPPVLAGAGTFTTTGTGAVAILTPVLAGTGAFATTGTGSITIGAPQVSASGPMFSFRDVGDSGTIVNGTPRVANIGTWDTVTDTGTRASILSTLDFAGSPGLVKFGGGASLGWHDPSLVESLARADIGAAVFAIRHQVGTSLVFHGLTLTSKPAAPDDAGIGIHRIASNYELHLAMNGLGTTNVKPARQNQFIRNCVLYAVVVPRPTGYLLFMSGGSWGTLPEASLVWVYETGTTDPLYLSHSAHTGEWQGRAQVVTPGSLTNELRSQNGIAVAFDSFNRADGALAGSQTEVGGYTWTNGTNATSTITGNQLTMTGTGTICNLIDTGRVPTETDPVRIEADMIRGASGNIWVGLVVRADSTGANRIQFNLNNTAWFLNENGGAGQISTGSVTFAASKTHRIILIDYGTRIKLFHHNVTDGTYAQLDGGNGVATTYRNTSTIVGLVRSTTSDTGVTPIDNFAVWPGRVTLPAFLFEGHTAAPDIDGAALFTDAFGGADGTLLASPWVLNGPTSVEQRSGKARLVSAASEGQATIDTGLTDIGVTANITIPASGDPNFYGLFVRWADASNHVMIRILYQGGSPEYEMIERIAGVSTMVQAVQLVTGTIVLGGTYAVKVVAQGNRIAAYLDGELVHEYSTTLTAGTRVGLGSPVGTAVSAGVPTWDDVSIFVPLGGTPPASITGTGAVTIGAPALAGTGTVTAASGSGAVTIAAPVLAGAGTFSTTGSGALSIGVPALDGVGTFTAAPSVTGTGAVSIGAPSIAGSGTFATTGAGALTIGPPALSGAGSFATVGTGSVAFVAPVLAGAGTFSTTGTGTVAIAAPSLAGAGSFATVGAAALTIAAPTLDGAGTFTDAPSVTGTGAVAIAAPVLAGSGTFSAPGEITGTGDVAILAPVLDGTGAFTPGEITGSGDVTVSPPALSGAGTFATTGAGALSIAAPALDGSGAFTTIGTGAVTLASPVLAGSGTAFDAPVTGTGALTISAPVLEGDGTFSPPGEITGTGAVAIGGPALAAAGSFTSEAITGTGSLTITAPAVAGTGAFETTGSGSLTIAQPSLSGAGTFATVGTGAVTIGGPNVSAVGIFTITGTSVITISAPGLAGTGDFTTTGTGAIVIGPPSLSGAEVLPTPPGTVGGGSVLVGSVGGYSVRIGAAAGGGVLVGSVTGGGAP